MSDPVDSGIVACSACGEPWPDVFCVDCCRKQTPEGPPLKRLRKFGFKLTYIQRQQMKSSARISGTIPTKSYPDRGVIQVSALFVACDGKTYIHHDKIASGGSSLGWSESYPQNVADQATAREKP